MWRDCEDLMANVICNCERTGCATSCIHQAIVLPPCGHWTLVLPPCGHWALVLPPCGHWTLVLPTLCSLSPCSPWQLRLWAWEWRVRVRQPLGRAPGRGCSAPWHRPTRSSCTASCRPSTTPALTSSAASSPTTRRRYGPPPHPTHFGDWKIAMITLHQFCWFDA